MTRQEVLDLYFLDARARLLDLGAFLDRLERADGAEDFRAEAFRAALEELARGGEDRARRILLALSDPTTEPAERAEGKSAAGAWKKP